VKVAAKKAQLKKKVAAKKAVAKKVVAKKAVAKKLPPKRRLREDSPEEGGFRKKTTAKKSAEKFIKSICREEVQCSPRR